MLRFSAVQADGASTLHVITPPSDPFWELTEQMTAALAAGQTPEQLEARLQGPPALVAELVDSYRRAFALRYP